MVSLDLLQLFVATADTGSIAGGARRVRLSPSAASRKLAALEQEVSSRLLIRSTRHLQFTAAGAIFLDWAKATISGFDRLNEALGSEKQEVVGKLKIATNEYNCHSYLADTLRHFRRCYPRLHFQATITDDPLALLNQGYDLAIHSGEPPVGSLIGRRLGCYRRILCASPSYLELQGAPTTLDDLAGHGCLGYSRSRSNHWYFRSSADRHPISQAISVVVEANSYPMLKELALKGTGILQIAELLVADELANGGLQLVLPDHACVEADGTEPAMWLVYPDRNLTSRSRLVLDFLIAQMTEGYQGRLS